MLRHFVAQQSGVIVNLASLAAQRGGGVAQIQFPAANKSLTLREVTRLFPSRRGHQNTFRRRPESSQCWLSLTFFERYRRDPYIFLGYR